MGWIRRLVEILRLVALRFLMVGGGLAEFSIDVTRYYFRNGFGLVDLRLRFRYLFLNPFRMSRRWHEENGSGHVPAYGETPFSTLGAIIDRCRLTSRDTLFEVGCGRGRTTFFISQVLGARVVGIDLVPRFIEIAEEVRRSHSLDNVEFRLGDYREADYSGATAVYFYATSSEPVDVEAFLSRLRATLEPGTKVITVSRMLSEFKGGSPFLLVESFPALYPWGTAEVYLQIYRPEKAPSGQ